jgi:hypothetical protein
MAAQFLHVRLLIGMPFDIGDQAQPAGSVGARNSRGCTNCRMPLQRPLAFLRPTSNGYSRKLAPATRTRSPAPVERK